MNSFCWVLSFVFITLAFGQSANASSAYTKCLNRAAQHAGNLLNQRGLHSSTRDCIRHSLYQAQNLLEQYKNDITPEMEAHSARIKTCKKDKSCQEVAEKRITYTTFHKRDCNRPRVSYFYYCDMDRTLEGYKK